MPQMLKKWGKRDLHVLYVLLHDRIEWPLIEPELLHEVPKHERCALQWRRIKLQELLPGRTWWAILSKLYRMGVTHERLQTILGMHYNALECHAPAYKDKKKQLSKPWKSWTWEECEALKTALLAMPEVDDRICKEEVCKRQTQLRESVRKRTWEAVYQKVVRDSPTGLGMKEDLHKKLGTKCRGDAKQGLTNPYKKLRQEVRDRMLEEKQKAMQKKSEGMGEDDESRRCERGASPEIMLCGGDKGLCSAGSEGGLWDVWK